MCGTDTNQDTLMWARARAGVWEEDGPRAWRKLIPWPRDHGIRHRRESGSNTSLTRQCGTIGFQF
jgi:hypothetical protein